MVSFQLDSLAHSWSLEGARKLGAFLKIKLFTFTCEEKKEIGSGHNHMSPFVKKRSREGRQNTCVVIGAPTTWRQKRTETKDRRTAGQQQRGGQRRGGGGASGRGETV